MTIRTMDRAEYQDYRVISIGSGTYLVHADQLADVSLGERDTPQTAYKIVQMHQYDHKKFPLDLEESRDKKVLEEIAKQWQSGRIATPLTTFRPTASRDTGSHAQRTKRH